MLDRILKAIKDDILALFKLILDDKRFGNNTKINMNTLKDSNLQKEARVDYKDNIFILYYNDYLEWIESGRKKKARKVPVKALVEWAIERRIDTDNETIYAIREAIYRDGIPPRPILSPFSDELDKQWEEWSEKIFEAISERLITYFNNNKSK